MVRIRKKSEITISPQELLTIKPIQNPLVETKRYDSGELALILKLLPTKRRGLISRFFPMPRGRKIVLDEMGTHFWELCNGKNKVKDIITIFEDGKYFEKMGTIISLNNNDIVEIYDGQQRIITIILILFVLYNKCDNLSLKEHIKTFIKGAFFWGSEDFNLAGEQYLRYNVNYIATAQKNV